MGNIWGDKKLILAICLFLLSFGFGYNWLMGWLGKRKEGFTWAFVVVGVLVVLGGGAIIDLNSALLYLLLFACGGFFMAAGDIKRYTDSRDNFQKREKESASHDDPEKEN